MTKRLAPQLGHWDRNSEIGTMTWRLGPQLRDRDRDWESAIPRFGSQLADLEQLSDRDCDLQIWTATCKAGSQLAVWDMEVGAAT